MSNKRTSLLGTAGDALASFAFGRRRRPSVRLPPAEPILAIPHVIDITAPPPDEELEERQRLRDAAAQSIGLRPLLEDPPDEEPVVVVPEPEPDVVLPPFGASFTTIAPFTAFSATLPKFYPPNRILSIAKPWKQRHVVLTVPAGRVSHLHLFKSAHPYDNRELERLEINADSAVFVAEEDFDLVHVVKVAGVDVGARRRDWNPTDDASRTVWLLHLPNSADAQQWISRIKAAIFEQRTHRAGLPPTPANAAGAEPRGDMDVMLSMRLAAGPQTASASPAPSDIPKQPSTPASPNGTYAASLAPSASERSVRSVATAPAPGNRSHSGPRVRPPSSAGARGAGTAAVAALKGLFTHSRPRSASSASLVSSKSSSFESGSAETAGPGDSFAHAGNLLAGKVGAGPAVSAASTNPPRRSINGHRTSVLERRILGYSERERVASDSDITPHNTPTPPHSTFNVDDDIMEQAQRRSVSYGLQPPPRTRTKRWPEAGVEEAPTEDEDVVEEPPLRMYTHPHANGSTGTAGSFGVRSPSVASVHDDGHLNTHLTADRISERSVSTGRSRASSVGNGTMRSNSGRGRRWSTLPRRLDPPDSPPPPTPSGSGRSIPHPYANTPASGDRASVHSFGSTHGPGKTTTSYRGKRASAISVQSGLSMASGASIGGANGNPSASAGSLLMTNSAGPSSGRVRTSMPPPPRPAPTTALPPAPASPRKNSFGAGAPPPASPNGRTSFRDSRSSSVSFREPPSAPLPAPATNGHTKDRSSFRDSMAQRAMRLSLIAPRPPPSTVLPPRPDEPQSVPPPAPAPAPAPVAHKLHRRSNSASATPSPSGSLRNSLLGGRANKNNSSHLQTVPGSPALPPPKGPLPPPPGAVAPLAKHASLKLKQRLRILSAPPAPHPQPTQEPVVKTRATSADLANGPASLLVRHNSGGPMTLASFLSISASTPSTPTASAHIPLPNGVASSTFGRSTPPPGTPIGEKIIQLNDASFLQMSMSSSSASSTPVLRPLPAPAAIAETEYLEVASLLPPPRRGSRHISVEELEPRTPTPETEEAVPLPRDLEAEGAGPGPGKLFSLSRHSSATSLALPMQLVVV